MEGLELIGEQEGSGFKEPPSLARRPDGQVLQLTPLLYAVAELADGERDLAAIAQGVSERIGRRVSVDNVRTLLDNKLYPLGVVAGSDGSSGAREKPDPLLALKFRAAVIPESVSRRLGSLLKPLFFPPVILAVLAVLVATDYWLFFVHGIAQPVRQALYAPGIFLIMLGAVIVSAAFHELGHATGCRYGGAEPGKMGCGLYLAWPAFYTDVTDAYRLGKKGRLRTDLGGVYFNIIFIALTMAVFLATHYQPLLLLVLIEHVEIVHQLLPIVRLDGYYIVADLTGVPDLFTRIKPVLASLIPGHKPNERVLALKGWVRVAITAWVLVVVPLLAIEMLLILVHLPSIFGTAYDSFVKQIHTIGAAFSAGNAVKAVTGILQVVALSLPIVGIVLMIVRTARRGLQMGWQRTAGRPVARAGFVALCALVAAVLAYTWLPGRAYRPIRPNQRGTLTQGFAQLASVHLRPGAGPAPAPSPTPLTGPATGSAGSSPAPGSSPVPRSSPAAGVLPSPRSSTGTSSGSSNPGGSLSSSPVPTPVPGSPRPVLSPAASPIPTASPLVGASPSP